MLSPKNFTETYIRDLQMRFRRDPALLERSVHAFGLLEAIAKAGLPFIFKGGTCLMLLLEKPGRLSTDIDIIVKPNTELDFYLTSAANQSLFLSYSGQTRPKKGNINKRHFKFEYFSPIFKRPLRILLDVLFEENHYDELISKPIENNLLITSGDPVFVQTPTADCILGDKLTAFAPHTTEIPLNVGKDLEVMKQFYDVYSLLDVFGDFNMASSTYDKIVKTEITFRNGSIDRDDCLLDVFNTSLCIASRGKVGKDEYPLYVDGIRELSSHVLFEKYSAETASSQAPKLMYAALCLLLGKEFKHVIDSATFLNRDIHSGRLSPLRHLRKRSIDAYAYVIKTDELLEEQSRQCEDLNF